MKVHAVIFDLDGTLTKPFLNFDQIRSEMGLSSSSVGILEAMDKMSPEQRHQAMAILDRHESDAARNARLNEGVHELLETLRQRAIAVGLLTRNTRQNTLLVAAEHNLKFDAIVDRSDGPVKPDGFGVRKLCEDFGVKPSETLVVGDFLHDLVSARDAGATAILMRTHPRASEFETQADYSIDRLEPLIPLMNTRKIE
jgi:HAD superfamily hydrolase (TIGR01509 family)